MPYDTSLNEGLEIIRNNISHAGKQALPDELIRSINDYYEKHCLSIDKKYVDHIKNKSSSGVHELIDDWQDNFSYTANSFLVLYDLMQRINKIAYPLFSIDFLKIDRKIPGFDYSNLDYSLDDAKDFYNKYKEMATESGFFSETKLGNIIKKEYLRVMQFDELAKSQLTSENLTVWRALRNNECKIEKRQKQLQHRFLSTTINFPSIIGFLSTDSTSILKHHILKINVSKGTKFIRIHNINNTFYNYEKEYLFPRNHTIEKNDENDITLDIGGKHHQFIFHECILKNG